MTEVVIPTTKEEESLCEETDFSPGIPGFAMTGANNVCLWHYEGGEIFL